MTAVSRPGPQPVDLLRRLRARPVSSWGAGDREAAMRTALQQLADLAAAASGSARRVVPDAGRAALPDQLAVLVAEARTSGVPATALDGLLTELAAALSVADR